MTESMAPSAPRTGVDQPYDDASVGSPFPVLATSGDGRAILRVYYGARDHLGGVVAGALRRDEVPLTAADQERRKKHPLGPFSKDRMPRDPVVLRGLSTNDRAPATTAVSAPEGPRV